MSRNRVLAGEAYVEATLEDGKIRRSLKTLGGHVTSSAKAIGRGLAVGISAGLAAGAVLIRSAIEKAADAQMIQTSFETMLGSAEAASELVAKIRALGASTPFESADLLKSTQVLLNFGASAEEAYASIKMLSDIAAGDAQKLGSLALVFGQIRSAGKLTGGDLLQLINVGFNPLLSISEKTGESMSDLRDRMSKGLVTFEEVRQAFVEATSEGGQFYQMNEKMSQTVIGRWAAMKDAWEMMLTGMGTAMLPFVESVMSYLENITNGFNITTENIGEVWGRCMESLLMQLEASGKAIDSAVLRWMANLRRGLADSLQGVPVLWEMADPLRRSADNADDEADKIAAEMVEIETKFREKFMAKPFPEIAPPIQPVTLPVQAGPIRGPVEAPKPPTTDVPTVADILSTGTFSGAGAGFLGSADNPMTRELQEANKHLKNIERNTDGDGPTFGA